MLRVRPIPPGTVAQAQSTENHLARVFVCDVGRSSSELPRIGRRTHDGQHGSFIKSHRQTIIAIFFGLVHQLAFIDASDRSSIILLPALIDRRRRAV